VDVADGVNPRAVRRARSRFFGENLREHHCFQRRRRDYITRSGRLWVNG
jgi:hypothetical protein